MRGKKKAKAKQARERNARNEARRQKNASPSATAYLLRFSAPVHFGAGRLSGTECTCDAGTLFSALYIEALRQGEERASRLLEAARSGELQLSDAFPFIDGEYYLPKPQVQETGGGNADQAQSTLARKAAKKLPYIPVGAFADYLDGTMDPVEESERFKELGRPYVLTKVNLTRASKPEADPYHVGGFRFGPGNGLFFLASGKHAGKLKGLLESLQYSGIGGERSSGYGRFDFEETGDPLAQLRERLDRRGKSGKHVLLSTAAPTEDELSDELLAGARYGLVRRGGFVQSATHSATPQKKRDLYAFSSGSVFEKTFSGDVFDVNATPGAHPVFRYARAMWMEV